MKSNKPTPISAKEILGNSSYQAMSYGGYRTVSRRVSPTISQVKEDMKILSALNIKIIRTYNVHLPEIVTILKAIKELQQENPAFEMYVMLGAWIDCKNAWTGFEPIHHEESERNATEINHAVELANQYPDIIKVIAVGNEAMVKWATAYYVEPWIILKWINHIQDLKKTGQLNKDIWVTTSDNFASWGGGESLYHTDELKKIYEAVDYISLHTYPMHDTHYHPIFWGISDEDKTKTKKEQLDILMNQSVEYAQNQYKSVENYMKSIGINKPIHIGETGWATYSNELYGNAGSKATDEYKSALYYRKMRDWTNKENISMFYFEAFDEIWKDAENPQGSENHFGLFTIAGKAKYVFWNEVDNGTFKGLKRDGHKITKTYNGNEEELMKDIFIPLPFGEGWGGVIPNKN